MQNPSTQQWQTAITSINDSTFHALKVAQEENWISEEQVKGLVNQLVTAVTADLRNYNSQNNPQ